MFLYNPPLLLWGSFPRGYETQLGTIKLKLNLFLGSYLVDDSLRKVIIKTTP